MLLAPLILLNVSDAVAKRSTIADCIIAMSFLWCAIVIAWSLGRQMSLHIPHSVQEQTSTSEGRIKHASDQSSV